MLPIIYLIGCILSFLLIVLEQYISYRHSDVYTFKIEDFFAFIVGALLSWIGVLILTAQLLNDYHDKNIFKIDRRKNK